MMEEENGLTREVARFIENTEYEDLPEESLRLAKRCLIDGTAVILSGSKDRVSRILRQYLERLGGAARSTVLGTAVKVPPQAAALANATSGHAQDFDDTQLSTSPDRIYGLLTHPTTPVLATAFALGEERGLSGKEVLTAFSLGIEVECKIAEAIHPIHYAKGYHTTATIGIFGAVTAAGKILNLPEDKMRHALGIAASMSAGIRASFGTMNKPLQVGRAAENGVVASHLAQLGVTSDPNVLENPWGFFKILGDGFDPDKISGKLGNPYTIINPGISIKSYPCGVLAHPSMDAMLDLAKEHHIKSEDVVEIRLYAGSNILKPFRYALPQTGLEGKFSLPFCLTSILLKHRAGIKEFSDEFVKNPEVQQVMKRTKTFLDPDIEAKGYSKILSRVEVLLKDGKILKKDSGAYKGGPENPLSETELDDKFLTCVESTLSKERALIILDIFKKFETLQDIRLIIESLVPDREACVKGKS